MNYIKFPFIMLYRMFVLSVLRRPLKLNFIKITNRWYVVFSEYPGPRANLEMVLGADRLCEALSHPTGYKESEYFPDKVAPNINISLTNPSLERSARVLVKQPIEEGSVWNGRTYSLYKYFPSNKRRKQQYKHEVWLCPVMLYTFGYYPKRIYIWKDYTN